MRYLIIFLFFFACSNKESQEYKALSHCADTKLITFANNNPHKFLTNSNIQKIKDAAIKRDKKIQDWIAKNHNPKDLMSIGKVRGKFNEISDPYNLDLSSSIINARSKISDITELNKKNIDWKVDYKKQEFFNYENFYKDCWNEYKKDNGYYENDFLDKYKEWKPQDVNNLVKYTNQKFNAIFQYIKQFQFTTKIIDFHKKLLLIIA
jgi:hypothetical protein